MPARLAGVADVRVLRRAMVTENLVREAAEERSRCGVDDERGDETRAGAGLSPSAI